MKHYTYEQIAENVLAARAGAPPDAELGRHLGECADCRTTADMLRVISTSGGGSNRCLSFDDLYDYRFGSPTAEHKAAVEGVLAECDHCGQADKMFRGLPGESEATAEAFTLPADLKSAVFASLSIEARPDGLLSRLGAAAREMVESMRETADAFVLSVGSAAAGLMRLARVAPAAEPAYAYDGAAVAEAPAPPALAALPRIRVEHAYLCLALAGEPPGDVQVALIDAGGREVARARPNAIGVVLFDRITPGTYGVRVEGQGQA
jgi:hypothetical protein